MHLHQGKMKETGVSSDREKNREITIRSNRPFDSTQAGRERVKPASGGQQ
jgi:hypothetical protein